MVIFNTELELLNALDVHDGLVGRCVGGEVSFREFLRTYDNFYLRYALDGHEFNDQELAWLFKWRIRVERHRLIAEMVLERVCNDEDAYKPEYVAAGRIGSATAVQLLSRLGPWA